MTVQTFAQFAQLFLNPAKTITYTRATLTEPRSQNPPHDLSGALAKTSHQHNPLGGTFKSGYKAKMFGGDS